MQGPETLIMDCQEEIGMLRFFIGTLQTPTVDWDALLSQLFYALVDEDPHHHDELMDFVNEASYNDLVFETNNLPDYAKQTIQQTLLRVGLRLKEKLMEMGAYHEGFFPYTLKAVIDDGCLFFSKNEWVNDSSTPDRGHRAA